MLPNGNNPSHRTGDVPEITPNGTQHSNSSPIDSLPPDPQPNQPSDFVQTLPEIPPPPTQYQSLAPVSPVEDMAFVATTQQLQYHGSSYPYGNNHEFEQPIPTGGPYTAYMATDFTGIPDWALFWGNSYDPYPAPEISQTPFPQNQPPHCFSSHQCQWLSGPQCDGWAPGKNREMAEHLRLYHDFGGHERDVVRCQWGSCNRSMQRMNLPRHIVATHLREAAECRFCGKRFSRPDVVGRHERTCSGPANGASGSNVGFYMSQRPVL